MRICATVLGYQARDGMGENPVVTWVGTFDEDDRTIQIQRFVPGQSGNGRNNGVIANISGLAARRIHDVDFFGRCDQVMQQG